MASKPRGRNAFAARRAGGVFAGFDAKQGARDLPQLFGHFDVERFEQLLIFEFHGLFGEVLRQRFFAVAGLAGNTAVPLEQFFLASEQRAFDLLMIHHVPPAPCPDHTRLTAGQQVGMSRIRQTIDNG